MIDIEYTNFDNNKASNAKIRNAIIEVKHGIKQDLPFYGIFNIEKSKKEAAECLPIAREINNKFSDLILVGMGGSSLNPEAVVALAGYSSSSTKIHFLNNTDPLYFKNLLLKVSLEKCAILAISNSGETLETNSLVTALISEYNNSGIEDIGKHFYFITNVKDGTLKNIASKINGTIIEHRAGISGRYSGLTNVTILAAQIAGIDVGAYIDGADSALNEFFSDKENASAAQSANLIFSSQKPITVNVGYMQQFAPFLEWYSQIIAESLGKDGNGITPIRGLGPNDQHSMFQLYLDGPQDKIFTMFNVQNIDVNHALKRINDANFEATTLALKAKNLPVRTFVLKDLSAYSIGSMVVHFMLEVILIANMMKINPFNQPGVELIKTESKRLVLSRE